MQFSEHVGGKSPERKSDDDDEDDDDAVAIMLRVADNSHDASDQVLRLHGAPTSRWTLACLKASQHLGSEVETGVGFKVGAWKGPQKGSL